MLPRNRRQPRRIDEGSELHQHDTPRDLYRKVYFEACDLLIGELTDRFNQAFMQPLAAMERLIVNAANGEDYTQQMDDVMGSVFGKDFDFPKLQRHVAMLTDVVRQVLPDVKKVTSVRTVYSAMCTSSHRDMFSELHKLIRLYLTVPVTSATSERAFSILKRLLTYLRSSMTQQRLNNCALLNMHKDILDEMQLGPIAATFASANEERVRYLGSFK